MHYYFALVKDQIDSIFLLAVVTKLLVVAVQMLFLDLIHSQVVIKLDVLWKNPTFLWNKFMNTDDNLLKSPGNLSKNSLLKSYLFLNLSNICINCKILKSVTINCSKKCDHICQSCLDDRLLLLQTS